VIAFRADLKIWIAAQPVDFRKSIHTLSALVSEALKANPYGGDVFVFRSKRADRVKLLAWDGSGMVLVTKWLLATRFMARVITPSLALSMPVTRDLGLTSIPDCKAQRRPGER
jgi:transposase